MGDLAPMTFYIGHHDANRQQAVSEEQFHHAEDLGVSFTRSALFDRR